MMPKLKLELKSSQATKNELAEKLSIAKEKANHHESSLKHVINKSLKLEDLLNTHQNQITNDAKKIVCDDNKKVPCQSECKSFGIK
jgi:hypothetical protein